MDSLKELAASYRQSNDLIETRLKQLEKENKQERRADKRLELRRRIRNLRAQSNDLIRTADFLEHYYDKD